MNIQKTKDKTAWLFVGQGSQHKGMGGRDLFRKFPDLVAQADEILGYSIEELCLEDPEKKLIQTQYSQPALYVVNGLEYFQALKSKPAPDFLAGHSLGEYNALLAADCFDFKTGLKLVKQRGDIMARAQGGGMAAVLGLQVDDLKAALHESGCKDKLDISNINSQSQIILSGDMAAIKIFSAYAREHKKGRVVPLAVSAAFHSQHMNDPAEVFQKILEKVEFREPEIPVISNVTGEMMPAQQVKSLLARQMRSCVHWWQSLMTLRHAGVGVAEQFGPGRILADLWLEALKIPHAAPLPDHENITTKTFQPSKAEILHALSHMGKGHGKKSTSVNSSQTKMGQDFCDRHGVRLPYVAGSMYRAIASKALVIRMAKNNLLSFFGAGGLSLEAVEEAITHIKQQLGSDKIFGMNFLAAPTRPDFEQEMIDLYLKHEIRYIEASAFTQVTEAMVQFRYHGAGMRKGRAYAPNKIFAKISRLEVARAFLCPPRPEILKKLYNQGRLNAREVEAAQYLPLSNDICMEADSGGHTDGGVALVMIPACIKLRDQMQSGLDLHETTAIGAGGGIGTPQAIGACFTLGAEFIVIGSINQCSAEAGTSDAVKTMLSELEIQDTTYAPAGDLFVTGARVQVVKRGTLFPARANYLYHIYQNYAGLSAIPERERHSIERYMGDCLEHIWQENIEKLQKNRQAELDRMMENEKARMARVFKSYFSRSFLYAQCGDVNHKVNFQVHSGPAMGAFNAFVNKGPMENWKNRHVDLIADELMSRVDLQQ